MALTTKMIAILFLAGSLIDGAFDSRGFDPWDYSADLPGGYFTLLRIAVTAAAAIAVWQLYQVLRRPTPLAILYGGIAVLYQPLVWVKFEYEIWLWIDMVVLAVFVTEVYASIRIGRAILRSGILGECNPPSTSLDDHTSTTEEVGYATHLVTENHEPTTDETDEGVAKKDEKEYIEAVMDAMQYTHGHDALSLLGPDFLRWKISKSYHEGLSPAEASESIRQEMLRENEDELPVGVGINFQDYKHRVEAILEETLPGTTKFITDDFIRHHCLVAWKARATAREAANAVKEEIAADLSQRSNELREAVPSQVDASSQGDPLSHRNKNTNYDQDALVERLESAHGISPKGHRDEGPKHDASMRPEEPGASWDETQSENAIGIRSPNANDPLLPSATEQHTLRPGPLTYVLSATLLGLFVSLSILLWPSTHQTKTASRTTANEELTSSKVHDARIRAFLEGEISAQEFVGSDSSGRAYYGPDEIERTLKRRGADESEPVIKALLEKGESALKAGDKNSARIAFKEAAKLGSAEAHFAIAYQFVNSPEQSAYHYTEAAKRGHQDALEHALDALFFRAGNLRAGNPKQALEVYRLAVNANAATRWPRSRNIDTIRKCIEVGAFDADAFIDAHGLAEEHNARQRNPYYVWELAEEAAKGGRFGPPNAKLVLHLVCRGGVVPAEVEFAVSTVYAEWKAGKTPDFNLCHFVSSRVGIGFCTGRLDREIAKRMSRLSFPEVTDNIWIVDGANILPTCLETVWASGDNYEEYQDQFPNAKNFFEYPGMYWGNVVPITAFRASWGRMISIPQRVQDCSHLKDGQSVLVENNVATVKDPSDEPNSYRLLAEWGGEECDKVVPTFAGKCHSLVFVVIDNAQVIYGRFYNTYAYVTESGDNYILPVTNGLEMGDFLELISRS